MVRVLQRNDVTYDF
uniref:Uncharacterized protein n=1 Tax=Lepeophtheirus salmonis TaxID=72036 RepID=A0A0K2UJQ5_LEPSM